MSFEDDCRDAPYVRPAITIEVRCTDGEHIQTIELPELVIPRSELSPEWLAMKEANVNEPNDDEKTEPRIDAAAQEPEVKPWGSFKWGEDVRAEPADAEEAAK